MKKLKNLLPSSGRPDAATSVRREVRTGDEQGEATRALEAPSKKARKPSVRGPDTKGLLLLLFLLECLESEDHALPLRVLLKSGNCISNTPKRLSPMAKTNTALAREGS